MSFLKSSSLSSSLSTTFRSCKIKLRTLKPTRSTGRALFVSTAATSPSLNSGFYIKSPLIPVDIPTFSSLYNTNTKVYLKLDNLQPSGSFKDRGISHMVLSKMKSSPVIRLISSSGGNAGHAVATVGEKLGIPVDVYVPTTTKVMMIEKLKKKGANVYIHGDNWNAADQLARKALENNKDFLYVPPYDDPLIWEGHSTIVTEIIEDGIVPDIIVVSVGGGGLLAGIQRGILRHKLNSTTVIATETEGTASYALAQKSGKVEKLSAITSIATSLGALSVTEGCLNTGVRTISYVVTDKDAVNSCNFFLEKQKMLVEPACGAALCYLYNNRIEIDVDNNDFTSRGSNSSGSNSSSSSSSSNSSGSGSSSSSSSSSSSCYCSSSSSSSSSNNNSDSSEESSQISSHIDHSQISETATNKENASVVVIVVCGGSVVSEDLLQQWSVI